MNGAQDLDLCRRVDMEAIEPLSNAMQLRLGSDADSIGQHARYGKGIIALVACDIVDGAAVRKVFAFVCFGYLAEHRLNPIVLVNGRNALRQACQFDDLLVVEVGGATGELAVRKIGQAMDDLGICVANGCHIEKSGRLVGDDEAFAVCTHLGDGI